ncbi:hypothetical protein GGR34_003693 [Microvirga flocculans]|uniref:DUF4376 domain-containing protein n=1 Tax=Microvirga flocculans TaxID=217168 RepID=A0A7W6IID3_9HYPH|nr:DUF4376 domain-containing protein [Microvirga flocculans]MBB4042008.1 hypothetical protein [Microvirga flocculans]
MNTYDFANPAHTEIWAVEDGIQKTIPVDTANADFCRLVAEQVEIRPFPVPVFDPAAYLAEERWKAETGGITVTVGGEAIPVSTARGDDRAALDSTYAAIRDGLRQDGDMFKFADNKSRAMSNDDMQTVILAVLGHVQACFNVEGALLARIDGGEAITAAIIDAALAAIPRAY